MKQPISLFIQERLQEFDMIPSERKAILENIALRIKSDLTAKANVELVYICIQNSRRSFFGQIASATAADYFGFNQVKTYSGGTVVTAFNPNAMQAITEIGYSVETNDQGPNPKYTVSYGTSRQLTCFSKLYEDAFNPQRDFIAIMTCGEAEENCPFIANAAVRFSTTYEDPKKSDGTPEMMQVYKARFAQILRESLYLYSTLKKLA